MDDPRPRSNDGGGGGGDIDVVALYLSSWRASDRSICSRRPDAGEALAANLLVLAISFGLAVLDDRTQEP